MEILSDTLLIEFVASYTLVDKKRRARQKEKFIFFDLGVRNSLLGNNLHFTKETLGQLFEQWIILQVIYYNRLYNKGWKISSYRDAMGVEVDLIIESSTTCLALEIKSAKQVKEKMFKGLNQFEVLANEALANRVVTKCLIYQGEFEQNFEILGNAIPYQLFLEKTIPSIE